MGKKAKATDKLQFLRGPFRNRSFSFLEASLRGTISDDRLFLLSLQDVKPTQFDHNRKNSLQVHLRGLDEIIGQAIDHLKTRGEL